MNRGSLYSLSHTLQRMLSYFHHFSIFMWKDEKNSNTLCVDAYFFLKENISVFKKCLDMCRLGMSIRNVENGILEGKITINFWRGHAPWTPKKLTPMVLLARLQCICQDLAGGYASLELD